MRTTRIYSVVQSLLMRSISEVNESEAVLALALPNWERFTRAEVDLLREAYQERAAEYGEDCLRDSEPLGITGDF